MGGVTEIATSAPGYNSLCSNTKAALAMTLELNGIQQPSSENATKCLFGRRLRWDLLIIGRREGVASNTSTDSSVAKLTNGIRRS